MGEGEFRVVAASSLKVEEGAHELLNSPDMQPYARFLEAVVLGSGVKEALEGIARLPLEKRYVWRVASALKWAFADCDTENVNADKATLSAEGLAKVLDLVKLRPIQFCMFLKALVGAEKMERVMMKAIAVAKQQG